MTTLITLFELLLRAIVRILTQGKRLSRLEVACVLVMVAALAAVAFTVAAMAP